MPRRYWKYWGGSLCKEYDWLTTVLYLKLIQDNMECNTSLKNKNFKWKNKGWLLLRGRDKELRVSAGIRAGIPQLGPTGGAESNEIPGTARSPGPSSPLPNTALRQEAREFLVEMVDWSPGCSREKTR